MIDLIVAQPSSAATERDADTPLLRRLAATVEVGLRAAGRVISALGNVALLGGIFAAAVAAGTSAAAGVPLLTARYDDAYEYLPKAEAANTSGQRLHGAALNPPSFDRLSVSGSAPVLGGDCDLFSTHSYFRTKRNVIHKSPL